MSHCPFCNLDAAPPPPASPSAPEKRSPGRLRRAWRGTRWLFPATLLVVMPKCPMCVAAYVALFTGLSVSISTAEWIRFLMMGLCVASLVYFAVRVWRARRSRAMA